MEGWDCDWGNLEKPAKDKKTSKFWQLSESSFKTTVYSSAIIEKYAKNSDKNDTNDTEEVEEAKVRIYTVFGLDI